MIDNKTSPYGYTVSVYNLIPENNGYEKLWAESSKKMKSRLEAEIWARDFVYSHAKSYSLHNEFSSSSLYFRKHKNDDGLDIFVVCGTDYMFMVTVYERTEEILSQKDEGFFTKDTI